MNELDQTFWELPCIVHPTETRWTCVSILGESQSEHYNTKN